MSIRKWVIGLLLFMVVGVLGLRWSAGRVWPTTRVAVRVPPSPFPPDARAEDVLEGLREAMKDRERPTELTSWLARGAHGEPPGGWPDVSSVDAPWSAVAGLTGIDLAAPPLDAPAANFMAFLDAATLQLVDAVHLHREGRPADAAARLAQVFRVAHLLQMGGGGLLLPAVGGAIEENALGVVGALRGPEIDAAVRPALETAARLPSGAARGVATECVSLDDLFRRFGEMTMDELMARADGSSAAPGGFPVPGFVYDADKSRALVAARCNAVLEAAARPPMEREWPAFESLSPSGLGRIGAMLDNPVGRILIDVAQPSYRAFVEREDALRASRAGALR